MTNVGSALPSPDPGRLPPAGRPAICFERGWTVEVTASHCLLIGPADWGYLSLSAVASAQGAGPAQGPPPPPAWTGNECSVKFTIYVPWEGLLLTCFTQRCLQRLPADEQNWQAEVFSSQLAHSWHQLPWHVTLILATRPTPSECSLQTTPGSTPGSWTSSAHARRAAPICSGGGPHEPTLIARSSQFSY